MLVTKLVEILILSYTSVHVSPDLRLLTMHCSKTHVIQNAYPVTLSSVYLLECLNLLHVHQVPLTHVIKLQVVGYRKLVILRSEGCLSKLSTVRQVLTCYYKHMVVSQHSLQGHGLVTTRSLRFTEDQMRSKKSFACVKISIN